MRPNPLLPVALLLAVPGVAGTQEAQRFADLGTCPTVGGPAVRECRIGFRVYGTLNARRDNAVLIPTWYGGRSETMTFLVGPDGWVDTTRYFAILMDAPGNGVSTSPSNSRSQPGAAFPRLTLEDMVSAQHRAVTESLGIRRLHAVVGWSMGGMQAIAWALRYPESVDRIVSVAGTPRMGSYDLYWIRSLLTVLDLAERAGLPQDTLAIKLAEVWHTVATTPAHENRLPRASMDSLMAVEARQDWWFHPWDNRLQLQALARFDAFPAVGGSRPVGVAPRLHLLFFPEDHVTTPEAFRAFAAVSGADTVTLSSPCGHMAPLCDPGAVGSRVRRLLDPSG